MALRLSRLALEAAGKGQLSLGWCNMQKTLAFLRPLNVTSVVKMALGFWLADAISSLCKKAYST